MTKRYTYLARFIPSIMIVSLSACSFVDVQPGAENIILANDESSCDRIGTTTVSVKHEVGFYTRDKETVADELQTLAQNSAFKMGGNAIWPDSDIEGGERSYIVYRCRNR